MKIGTTKWKLLVYQTNINPLMVDRPSVKSQYNTMMSTKKTLYFSSLTKEYVNHVTFTYIQLSVSTNSALTFILLKMLILTFQKSEKRTRK